MVDPFYQNNTPSAGAENNPNVTTNSAWSDSQNPNSSQQQSVSPQQIQFQVQQIQQQQLLLQQQYAKLASVIANPNISVEQKRQLQHQMQQLNEQYNKNVQTLQSLGVNHVNKPTAVQVKSWSRLSIKSVIAGCLVLLVLVVGWLAWVSYFLMNNPKSLASIGLDPSTTKTLLQTFSGLFFGLIIFGAVTLIVVNIYRINDKSKIWYVLWSFFGLILFGVWVLLASRIMWIVNDISATDNVNAWNLLIWYMWDSTVDIANDRNLAGKLIAPSSVRFALNSSYFTNQILPTMPGANVTTVELDCGNGQKKMSILSNYVFGGSCVYFKKWEYPLSITVSYINTPTWEKLQKLFSGWIINFQSEINVASNNGSLIYNDDKTEMVVGKNPVKVNFDASSVFRDFNLSNYNINRYLSDDGEISSQNNVNVNYLYTGAKLYNIKVRFPDLNNYLYSFPVRVEQSDVPVCQVQIVALSGDVYNANIMFYDSNVVATDYQFDVLDKKNNSMIVDSIRNNKDGKIQYKFNNIWTYAIKAIFITNAGKQWSCESDDINIWASDFDIVYDIKYKSPWSPQFKQAGTETWVSFVNDVLVINEIPTIVQLNISNISPNIPGAVRRVLFDGKPIISSDNRIWEMNINTSDDHKITMVVEDTNRWLKTEKEILVKINRSDVVGKLIVLPDTVWIDPFTVTFDASTTVLNDPTDEIVYFSWDFGDGQVKRNLSESIIKHTYRYDSQNEIWEYSPVLTIRTKKWREISISPETNIIVKKSLSNLKINMESHPSQLANVWDRVKLSLQVDWTPSKIYWDFGNWKNLECNRRECVQATISYQQPWDYIIKATVSYENQAEVEWTIAIKVN